MYLVHISPLPFRGSVPDFLFILGDVILLAASVTAAYFSFQVRRIYLDDVMKRVTGISTVSFSLLSFFAFLDTALRLGGMETEYPIVRFGVALSMVLMVAAWLVLLRWARSTSVQGSEPEASFRLA